VGFLINPYRYGGNPIAAKVLGDWDASHYTDNGAKVLSLVDQSGRGNDLTQATDGSRLPLSAIATVSGKQVFQFTGGENYTLDPLNSGTMPPRDDICLITIARPNNVDQRVCLQVGTDGSSKGIGLAVQWGGFTGALINGVISFSSEFPKDNANRHVFLLNRSGTVLRQYADGRAQWPINGNTVGTPYTNVAIPGSDHIMPGDWRRSILANALTETEIFQLAAALATQEGATDNSLDPAAVYNQDDDFGTGATIDTTGGRRASSIPWTALNAGGSLTNAQSGGAMTLTLPQASSDIYRGFHQPDPNTDDTTYTYWIVKGVPSTVDADGNKMAVACIQLANQRMLSMSLGQVSGVRQIAIERHASILGGGDFDGYQQSAQVTGFSSDDFTKEWTFHISWNKTVLNCWYQIDGGQMQFLGAVSTGFFNNGLRADKIGLLVSSGNAAGGDTVGRFTDFKRMT
jgi:hypothetical protein